MEARGVHVDHSSVSRWAVKFLPMLEKIFRKHKRPVGGSWRMDETYIKVNGQSKYLYRVVDKEGATIDFLLRARRDTAAATRFFEKAMRQNGDTEKVTMDKSGANKAAMNEINQVLWCTVPANRSRVRANIGIAAANGDAVLLCG